MNSENTNNQERDISKWVFAVEGNKLFASDQEDIHYSYWIDGHSNLGSGRSSASTQTIYKYRPALKGWAVYGYGGTCVYDWQVDENGKRFYHEWGHDPVYEGGTNVDFIWVDRKFWHFKSPDIQDYYDKDPEFYDRVSLEEAMKKFPAAFPVEFPDNPKAERAEKFWTNFFNN